MDVSLTLERRRGEEVVLRDGQGRRFVLPAALVRGTTASVRIDPGPVVTVDPKAAGRAFLTALLTHA